MNTFHSNPRLLYLTISLIVVSGLSAFFVLPRMEDPQLVERGAFVHTVFPGADPTLVESQVSEVLEAELADISEIKELRSLSRESISTLSIELRDEVLNGDQVWSKVRDRLNDAEGKLPAGAIKPRFERIEFKAFAALSALRWESKEDEVNYAVLNRWSEVLEDRIKSIPGTEKIEFFGQPDEEILVAIDSEQLAALGLSVSEVSRQIDAADPKVSAGLIRGAREDFLIEVAGEFSSIKQIEQIPIRYQDDGGFVRLSDLASVKRTVASPPSRVSIVDGKHAIVLGTFIRNSLRIDHWDADFQSALDSFEDELPAGIGLDRLFTQNEYVASRMTTLLTNLLLGAAAVFLVILVLMGWRSAVVVSMALPLAALMVLFGMRVMSIPIHQMSITGLIIALGLLIDNAIVVVEEMTIRVRGGKSTAEAVSASVKHLALPLFGSTVTTAFAFAPIALMPGPAGEFVGSIAVSVIIAIFSSLFLAMTVIPAISARLISPGSEGERRSAWNDGFYSQRLASWYRSSLTLAFRWPIIGLVLGTILPVLGFVSATQLNEQFFPPADRDQLHIEVELGPSSSIASTLETTQQIRDLLLQDSDILRVDWFVGESAPTFYYNLIARRSNASRYAQAMVQLNSFENQKQKIHQLQRLLDAKFAHARVIVRQLEQGPPFDAPVEVRLLGPDLDRLQTLGAQMREILIDTPGVTHTRSELDDTLMKVSLDVDPEVARAAGLSLTEIARQFNAATEGEVGGSIIEATEELPVRVRLDDRRRTKLANFTSLDIVNSNANRSAGMYRGVPVTALGSFKLRSDFSAIQHFDGVRINEIQAFTPAGVLPSKVLSAFQARLANSDFVLPAGYSLKLGGESAKRNEAVSNLMANVWILVALIVATLVLSFGSFRIAGIVASVGLLSIGLGLGALWLFGFPFGFTAIVGAMGLMGVAINDSIVVLAALQSNPEARSGNREAAVETVSVATRHIVSTSLTTMAGFTPLIIAGGGFWPPLAVAIAGGVSGATILALYFAPSAYLLLECDGGHVSDSESPVLRNPSR